jgi:NAD(P)-dependent dehydrogenase (short-subunit alcohol dehydrogenase family)
MLRDKISSVTGTSSGMGRAMALICARENAKVVVSDICGAGGKESVELVQAQGSAAVFCGRRCRQASRRSGVWPSVSTPWVPIQVG